MKLTPLIKGAITGVVMVIMTLILYTQKIKVGSWLTYLLYVIYAAGILWTLFAYARSNEFVKKFGNIFGQGFRCFVIVTLFMVTFTGIFIKMHPEFAVEDGKIYREYLVGLKNYTPEQIDSMVASEQKNYLVKNVSMATFGFLIQGALYTAVGSGLLLMRRR